MSVQARRLREFERRGQEILDAALSLFGEDNWERVTVEQIAKKTGIGKGTIYKHFESKDEIYARLAIQFQLRIEGELKKIDNQLPVLDRFRLHTRAAWEMHLSKKELHRVFLYCSRLEFRSKLSEKMLTEMQAVELRVSRPSQEMIIDGIAQGLFRDSPLPLLMFGPQSTFWGAIQLIWSGYLGDIDHRQYLEEMTTFILVGLVHHDKPLISH
jgi:AcrR family transcriptional regulator